MSSKPDIISFGDTDFRDPLVVDRPPFRKRRSPIMCTLNDPKITVVDIQRMMEAGMNMVKIKMSHSTKTDKLRLLGKIDKAAMLCCQKFGVFDWPVATCVSLKTCVVRTGLLREERNSITINNKCEVLVTCDISQHDNCAEHTIFIDNAYLATDIKIGMEISVGCDEIILICTKLIDDKSVKCIVTKGGELENLAPVSVRGLKHSRPLLTKRDLQIVKFALEYEVDMIIVTYTRHVNTLKKIKQYIGTLGKKIKRPVIISGISTQQDLDNIDDIIKETDAIMFSREYLPYELESSKRFKLGLIQKWVSGKCRQAGKPLYVSGVGDSLLKGNYCDNEISDMNNALLEGVSGFILGDFFDPDILIKALTVINDVCCAVEPLSQSKTDFWRVTNELKMPINAAEGCVLSCAVLANQTNAKVIVIPTVSGRTVRALLHMRPSCIIITVSTNLRITRLLKSYRSVIPLKFIGSHQKDWFQNIEARINFAIEFGVKSGWLLYGDTYVTLHRGTETSCFCDKISVWKVTIYKKTMVECLDDEERKEIKES